MSQIETARIKLSRDPTRIRRDIEALPKGLRPKTLATQPQNLWQLHACLNPWTVLSI